MQVFGFWDECKQVLVDFCQSFLVKSPLQYPIVQSISCLDPKLMVKDKPLAISKFKKVLTTLVNKRSLPQENVDGLVEQFSEFIDSALESGSLSSFSKENMRLDQFFYKLLASETAYSSLWCVLKQVLLLSHGEGSVERGFSINKELEDPSLAEDTLVAMRHIIDFVRSKGGVCNVNITPQLLVHAGNAHQKYKHHILENEKKLKNERGVKRKAVESEIDGLKKKYMCLEKDIEALNQSADKYSERAETERNFSLIAHANSLRKKMKEKKEEGLKVQKQLDEKVLQLKNSVYMNTL